MNLLSRTGSRAAFPALDPEQHARFESRLGSLAAAVSSSESYSEFIRQFERRRVAFEGLLGELEHAESMVTALELLDAIEGARLEASARRTGDRGASQSRSAESASVPPNGELICYWPGRSLSTGEAGVSSLGFFDALDRPPIGFWIEAVARALDSAHEKFEIVIIAWIPAGDVERATKGRRACTSGSLAMLDETSQTLARQLRPVLVRYSPK